MSLFFIITGVVAATGLAAFGVVSIFEKERRAAAVSFLLAALFLGAWLGAGAAFPGYADYIAAGFLGLSVLGAIFFTLPLGRKETLEIDPEKAERFDEREIMFARLRLEKDSKDYEEFYSTRLEMKEADESLKRLSWIGEPGGRYYNVKDSNYFNSVFAYLDEIKGLADFEKPLADEPVKMEPEEATLRLKAFAKKLGALDARVTELKDYHLYSNVGRGAGEWGEPIDLDHKYAVAITVEMDQGMVRNAPSVPTAVESSVEYLKSATVVQALAWYCASLGYRARAHVDGNYRVLATAVAHDAGLGEIGRLGLLVTPTHGPRVRIAVMTTDMPLAPDGRRNFGVQHFCRFCMKCADNCPGQAIERGDKKEVRGAVKWQSVQEKCLKYWLISGTDCGLCLAVCPYSKPATFFHNVVRFFCARNALARRGALLMDDVFYGRRPRHLDVPAWFEKPAGTAEGD